MLSSFNHLRDFIQKQMRMSHIYQPVMIGELLKRGGKAAFATLLPPSEHATRASLSTTSR
jgi:hypothetical protein